MVESLIVNWQQCEGNVWCSLNAVNINHSHFDNMSGVYIIWHGGARPKVVYVGKGNVRERIQAHRQDKRIQAYASYGLFVTWASVAIGHQRSVEAYLENHWRPKVGERHPEARHIQVNSPWN